MPTLDLPRAFIFTWKHMASQAWPRPGNSYCTGLCIAFGVSHAFLYGLEKNLLRIALA